MKRKFYLLTTLIFLSFCLYAQFAQKYNFMIMEEWKDNVWKKTSKSTNTYDSNGNLTSVTYAEWNAISSTWDNSTIISYTLNSDGTIKENLIKTWNKDGKIWEDVSKSIFTYNTAKKILTETTQIWFGAIWMDYNKNTYTYSGNQLTSEVSQSFDFFSMQLKNSSQTTYSYNADGTENQSVDQTWNASGQWENSSRTTNTYNATKQITSILTERWVSNTWINDSKITNIYNPNGTLKESLDETWTTDKWVNDLKDVFSYNTNGKLEIILTQEWKTDLNNWVNQSRTTFDVNITGIQPIELKGMHSKVFPNPFEENLTIQHASPGEIGIDVFSITGQLVISFKMNSSVTTLNLGSLQKGVYFLKIKSAQNEQTFQLLKTK